MQILHPLHLHLQGVWETMQCSEDDKECIAYQMISFTNIHWDIQNGRLVLFVLFMLVSDRVLLIPIVNSFPPPIIIAIGFVFWYCYCFCYLLSIASLTHHCPASKIASFY